MKLFFVLIGSLFLYLSAYSQYYGFSIGAGTPEPQIGMCIPEVIGDYYRADVVHPTITSLPMYNAECGCYNKVGGGVAFVQAGILFVNYSTVPDCNSPWMGGFVSVTGQGNDCDFANFPPDPLCSYPISEISAPIPTLSQWSLIILGLCLSIVGIVVIRQRYIVLPSKF